MRIIAGNLGGRQFDSSKRNRTHPMSDKIRGGLFNALGDITSLTVLDAFSGTGAIAFEAASRGAAQVIAIEIDKAAHNYIQANIINLGLEQRVKAIRANVAGWLQHSAQVRFDIIICDPPFDHLQLATIKQLAELLKRHGTFVLCWPGGQPAPEIMPLSLSKQSSYGDAQLAYFQ